MAKKDIVNTLVVTESFNDADDIKRRLQEAGHVVRVDHVASLEDLDEALDSPGWDLVMLDVQVEDVSIGDALELMRDKGIDACLLAIARRSTPEDNIIPVRMGARDVIPWEPEDYLSLVVDRELSTLYDRRAFIHCRAALAESEQRARMLLESSIEAVGYLHEGMHIYANPTYLAMFGYDSVEELSSIPILDLVNKKQHKPFKKFLRTHSRDGAEPGKLDLIALRSNGDEFNVSLMLSPARLEGEPCIQAVFTDKTVAAEKKQKKAKETKPQQTPRATLEDITRIDPLTRVFTSQYFLDQLAELASSGKSGTGVLMLSLDGFASVRDKVGLAGTDDVLKDTATMLRESVGDSGWLARLGNESFAYVDDRHTTSQMEALAETLRKQVEDNIFEASGQSITTTASLGIYPADYTVDDPEAVLARMEQCISAVQANGGNGSKVYHPGDSDGDDDAKARLLQLKEALAQKRITPLFQAIINLQGETHETYRVLPCITSDTGDRLSPEHYIEVAKSAKLVETIDKLLFSHLLTILGRILEEGRQPRLLVPLSEESLINTKTPKWLASSLKKAGMDGELLTIEIPEQLAVKYLKQVQTFIAAIKPLGFKTALEIGNVPSAFHHMKQMDVDFFELPANLIRELSSKEDVQEQVQGLTKDLLELGKPVIADGVQDANTMALLWEYGADYVHGNYVHKPTEVMSFDFTGGG